MLHFRLSLLYTKNLGSGSGRKEKNSTFEYRNHNNTIEPLSTATESYADLTFTMLDTIPCLIFRGKGSNNGVDW